MEPNKPDFYTAFYNSPPLWKGIYSGLEQFIFPEIDFNTFLPLPLPAPMRLGHQIEFICRQLLQQSTQYRIVLHNLPIRQDKISIGELDLILQKESGDSFLHLELTYKFYIVLNDPGQDMGVRLIGPNNRDAFTLKRDKLLAHQLPLLHRPESIAALRLHRLNLSRLQQQVCFKAQLFIPDTEPIPPIPPFNPDCTAGRWITFDQFDTAQFYNYSYYLPTKLEWLLPPHDGVIWKSYSGIIPEIRKHLADQYSPMVWIKERTPEIQKVFILWWTP